MLDLDTCLWLHGFGKFLPIVTALSQAVIMLVAEFTDVLFRVPTSDGVAGADDCAVVVEYQACTV